MRLHIDSSIAIALDRLANDMAPLSALMRFEQ
jgi:hypothetical protein